MTKIITVIALLIFVGCAVQITTPVEYNDQGTPIEWAPVETLKDDDD